MYWYDRVVTALFRRTLAPSPHGLGLHQLPVLAPNTRAGKFFEVVVLHHNQRFAPYVALMQLCHTECTFLSPRDKTNILEKVSTQPPLSLGDVNRVTGSNRDRKDEAWQKPRPR